MCVCIPLSLLFYLKNCENFLLEYEVDLKKSIEGQFPVETISSTAMV